MNLDRFSSNSIPDPQEAPVLAECSISGLEFHSTDEKCYIINGKIVHPDEVEETTVGEALEVLPWSR